MKLLLEKLVVIQRLHHGSDKDMVPLTRKNRAGIRCTRIHNLQSGFWKNNPASQQEKIVPLQFFDRSLSIRTIIKEMIEEETNPLSDSNQRNT